MINSCLKTAHAHQIYSWRHLFARLTLICQLTQLRLTTVRTSKLKRWDLELRKFYCKVGQGDKMPHALKGPEVPEGFWQSTFIFYFFFSFIFISWRLITLQYCSGFCHTLTWISHGFTCVPHPDPPSCLPPHPIPLGLPSAPTPSPRLMHPTWAGDLFHPW